MAETQTEVREVFFAVDERGLAMGDGRCFDTYGEALAAIGEASPGLYSIEKCFWVTEAEVEAGND